MGRLASACPDQVNTVSSLYVHVPFCRKRCAYCHFAIKVLHPRSQAEGYRRRFLEHLALEADHWSQREVAPLETIFLGGGTPSQLGLAGLGQVLQLIHERFELAADCEINVEINPEDADAGFLAGLGELGFTRISFGVQSFHDLSLQAIGRGHSGAQAYATVAGAPRFKHGLSFDLILGLPHQSEKTLRQDLARILELDPEHVSLYMLERDLPTPLDKRSRGLPMPSEDEQADYYELVRETLVGAGYEHYEISNFAKPGKRCRHNLVYWRCGDYLALGPAAVGRLGLDFYTNHEQLQPWSQAVAAQGNGLATHERWSEERLRQEQLVQGMRLAEGIPRDWVDDDLMTRLAQCFDAGLLDWRGERLCLSARGQLLGNEVFGALIG